MPLRQYVLTLTGSAQQLSTVFSAAEKESNPAGPAIIGYTLQPNSSNANPIGIGSSGVTSVNVCAVRLSSATAGVAPAPYVREFSGSYPVKLGDLYAIGTSGEKLHIGIDVE